METQKHEPQRCPNCGSTETATLRTRLSRDDGYVFQHWCARCHPEQLAVTFKTRESAPPRLKALLEEQRDRRRRRSMTADKEKKRGQPQHYRDVPPPPGKIKSPQGSTVPGSQGRDARPPGYTRPPPGL